MLSPRERDDVYYQASMEYAKAVIEIAESAHDVIRMAEVQKIIMIARGDVGSPFSWLPRDVCKLIHRVVFADVRPI